MPGVGPRSAERIALWMVQARDARPRDIATATIAVCEQIKACPQCGFFTSEPLCEFCAAPDRDDALLCVVEQPTDILPLERTGVFRGRYHALGGRISPLEHVGPDDLRIASLIARVQDGHPCRGHPRARHGCRGRRDIELHRGASPAVPRHRLAHRAGPARRRRTGACRRTDAEPRARRPHPARKDAVSPGNRGRRTGVWFRAP